MKRKIVLLCDGSIDGMMTAIFKGFEIRNERFGKEGKGYSDDIQILLEKEYTINMFSEYISVDTDHDKAYKTARAIRNQLGIEAYEMVIKALCHFDSERATIVFGFLIRGFKNPGTIMDRMADSYVMRTFELARKSGNESHLFLGFVRFKDVGGTLYSVINPKCNVIPLIGEHFNERYPGENWIIYDKGRNLAAVHKKQAGWLMISDSNIDEDILKALYEKHDIYEDLWQAFFDSLFIKERRNEKCQNNLIPKWYRENMTEFQDNM